MKVRKNTKQWPRNLTKKELLEELQDSQGQLDAIDNEVWELRKECERRKIDPDTI